MASKKSWKKKKEVTTPPEKNQCLVMYPRTRRISPHDGPEERRYVYKPIKNSVWKEIKKLQKEKAARDKARIILKKKKKRSQAKIRKKQQQQQQQLLNN